ncbi:MAG TPA: LysE/ArgO family amino acid transporter [Aggregatilineales bacterium]|nr:LysE/ArgO family amino acid transporter [Aggregatilineales bacterium]
MTFAPLLRGFGLGAGLIIAIGAQNAFVLRQGLKRNYPFATAAICAINDAILILLGVAGLGTIISQSSLLTTVAAWGGAAFLLLYGLRSFRAALYPGHLKSESDAPPPNLRGTIFAAIGFSLLNPHVYIDTVVILGSVGAAYAPDERGLFAIGAILASVTWFFGLVYGASLLAPLFSKPGTWRILDIIIGCIMLFIAVSLIREIL